MKIEPGVLAFIIKSSCGNNGKIVKVGACLGESAKWEGKTWNKGRVSWLVTSEGSPLLTNKGNKFQMMPIAEDQLKPIEPLKEDEDVNENCELPAGDEG